MSQLSIKLNQQKGATSQDLSFLNEASPIYVTSLSGNSVTTSSSSTTAAKGPGTNELIVADSSDYARAQQDHVRQQQQGIIKPPGTAQQVVQVAADEVNQNIVVNKQPPANNKCISATSGVTSSCGGGVANTNRTVAANNNSSSTQNYNNNLVNSNISGSSFNRAGADKGPGDPIVGGGNNNNNVNNFASSRSLDYNNFYETNNNESRYSFSNGHSIGGGGGEESADSFHAAIKGGTEVLLGDQTYRLDNRPRRKSGFGDDEDPLKPRYHLDEYLSDNNNPIDLQQAQQHHHQGINHQLNSDIEMLTMLSVNQDNGPHREMAVDVPESFIARNKTPPRYPPRSIQNTKYHAGEDINQKPHFGELIKFPTNNHNGKKSKKSEAMDDDSEVMDDGTANPVISTSITSNGGGDAAFLGLTTKTPAAKTNVSTTSSSDSASTSDSFNDHDIGVAPPVYNLFDESLTTGSSFHDDSGPHRELPVDVPDNFVGTIKQTPRYPPLQQTLPSISTFKPQTSVKKELAAKGPAGPINPFSLHDDDVDVVDEGPPFVVGLSTNGVSTGYKNMQPQPQTPKLNGSSKPVPPPRDHLRVERDGRLVNIAVAPQVPDRNYITGNSNNNNHQIAQVIEPTHEQEMSIKKFQEQLRRRKEEEERIAQENEFLRASLRGSRKLQALQDGPVPQERAAGVENDAFLEDDEVTERPIVGYGDLVNALQRLQAQLNKNGLTTLSGRVAAAQSLLLGPGVARAMATRAAVLQRRRPRISNPVTSNAQLLAKDCVETLAQSNSSDAIELCDLLSTYEMEGLFQAHDRIAANTDRSPAIMTAAVPMPMKLMNHMANPILQNNITKPQPLPPREPLPAVPLGILRDGGGQDHIRIIQIEKSSEPLGATVRNEGEAIVIGRIVRGGAAEKSGLLHEGDEILEVNGTEMRGKSVNDVCAILAQMVGTLTFLIVPAGSPPPGGGVGREQVLHVRAHFDYDPEDDLYIPCRELGISFQKGDVLHVISRDDPNWWQAYREGEEDQTLAGLIPSQQFQHQRETMKLAIAGESGRGRNKDVPKGATLLCARKGRKKKKKTSGSEAGYPLYATTTSEDPEPEEILTYEEVSLYYPRASHKRPIVLIGPPNIGRHELRQRLMADSDRFAAAVPHTSRQQREGEVPGQDYHFITRAQFESDILARKFVEHGEYEKAYYGTSLEAIRAVVAIGKICVLNLHPQSLKLLRSSDLKPYVVLVAPPSLEKLRLKKIRSGEPFKEDELKDIIATARDMEARWGHLFDMIIINNETERAYHQLLTEINSLEREPQWVPSQWIHN